MPQSTSTLTPSQHDPTHTATSVLEGMVVGVQGRCSLCDQERVIAVCWCDRELCSFCVGLHAAWCPVFPWVFRGVL